MIGRNGGIEEGASMLPMDGRKEGGGRHHDAVPKDLVLFLPLMS